MLMLRLSIVIIFLKIAFNKPFSAEIRKWSEYYSYDISKNKRKRFKSAKSIIIWGVRYALILRDQKMNSRIK